MLLFCFRMTKHRYMPIFLLLAFAQIAMSSIPDDVISKVMNEVNVQMDQLMSQASESNDFFNAIPGHERFINAKR